MKCPNCGKKMIKLSSAGVEREDQSDGNDNLKIEAIVYEQCMNTDCANNDPFPFEVKEETIKLLQ